MNEPTSWQLYGFIAGLIAAWSLVIIGTTKWVLSAGLRSVRDQFMGLQAEVKSVSEKQEAQEREMLHLKNLETIFRSSCEEQQRITRDVLEVKADLPLHYVRKEDFIRHEVVINTKLDRLRDLIEDKKN